LISELKKELVATKVKAELRYPRSFLLRKSEGIGRVMKSDARGLFQRRKVKADGLLFPGLIDFANLRPMPYAMADGGSGAKHGSGFRRITDSGMPRSCLCETMQVKSACLQSIEILQTCQFMPRSCLRLNLAGQVCLSSINQ
jgi:hypothetical protein